MKMRWLIMIPFYPMAISVGANDAVFCCDPVPLFGFRAAGAPNSIHVHSKSIGVKRVEFVRESTHSEHRRPIG